MRQTLLYLPTQIFGVPLFGKGILFWAILLTGVVSILRAVFLRKKPEDGIFYACVTALGLFVVNVLGPRIAEPEGFPIRGYGVFLTLAIIVAGSLAVWRGKKMWNFPVESVLAIAFVAALFGIIGARVFYVAQYWRELQEPTFRETLISALDLTNGGLVVYGSIIGGCVSGVVYLLIKRLPLLPTLDLFAPALMLGIAIGRIGCLMNGCCFGGICDKPWAIVFPTGSPAYAQQVSEGVISLYGITLAPPQTDEKNADPTLFHLKSKHVDLATTIDAPVIVASVDPGSEAEAAGIKPGDRICEMGIVPEGLLQPNERSVSALNGKKIKRFRPENNAQFFHFFTYMWNEKSKSDVILVLQEPQSDKESQASNSAAPEEIKLRNVVYHPTPAKCKPVHPTQIYSSLSALLICCILLVVAKFAKKDGIVFAAMAMLYPLNRFCLELLRTDEESFCGTGLTVSQCVSVCVFAFGVCVMIYSLRGSTKRALEGFFPQQAQECDSEQETK